MLGTIEHLRAVFEVVIRSDDECFKVIPQRWIVERFIAWLTWFRFLSRDCEANMETSEVWELLASIVLMIENI